MIKQVIVRPSSQYADRSLMYPGEWIETWLAGPGGVWWLIGFNPKEAKQCTK